MAAKYTLELFPTEGNMDKYVEWFGASELERNNDNAGVDLYCVKTQAVTNHTATLLDLGVKARMIREFPNGVTEPCHYWLAPRSSIWKSGVRQANSLGVIDLSYRGVLMGAVLANSMASMTDPVGIQGGNRLFQVLAPDMGWIHRVRLRPLEELDETSRGEGGFGSTGQ